MAASRSWNDAEVIAFVEGRLEAQDAARFGAQVQHDLALAERVARQRRQRQLTAQPATTAPAQPGALSRQSAAVTARAGSPSIWWWAGAIAAVLLAAWLGTRLPAKQEAPLVTGPDGVRAAGLLAAALTTRAFIDGPADGVLISLSFRAGDGRYCRTFSLDIGIDGLACRSSEAWHVEAIGRSPGNAQADNATVRLASSELSPSVLAAIARWQAGNALTPEEERRVRDRDWR